MSNQSPFLNANSFETEEFRAETIQPSAPSISPFLALYEFEEGGERVDPQAEEYMKFLNELYDEEFNEALAHLVGEARAIYEAHFPHEQEDPQTTGYQAERLLNQHFAPLVAESEAIFDSLAREFGQRDPNSLSEDEIDALVNRYQPPSTLSPSFEEFGGFFKKVAGKAINLARKGISAAASLGLGPILNKLKSLIQPLLKRVIKFAIGKLPAQLQPIARKLAERVPFLKEFEVNSEAVPEVAKTGEIEEIQNEFNLEVANLMFAHTEVEQELEVARVITEQAVPETYPLAELDQARERFVEKLQQLKEGEDPAPLLEDFIPAILPALKIGIKLIGRQKVVNFLANLLAKLVQKFIGPQYAPALSKAIVDAGLRLIHLEATAEDESGAAASAVAATVEETVRRVAALPEYVLDNQELLEGFALEAFEQAAAANLPPVLPEETYKKRPDLGEARKLQGTWFMLPRGRRKRFKKFGQIIQRDITPHKVSELETLDGTPLDEFLEEQLGVAPGEEVEAFVHLYEAIPGTHLSDIARHEENISQVDSLFEHSPLHPLTRQAAAMLTGEPELGRDAEPGRASGPHSPQAGQRFYYLEIPGKRPLTVPTPAGRAKARRPTRARLVLDFPKNEARIYVFLSEIQAQMFAVNLRQHAHIGVVTARLHRITERGLRKAIAGKYGRLKIIHEAVIPGRWAEALKRLPSIIPQVLKGKLTEWTVKALADHLKQRAEEFKNAAENTSDGVTLVITLGNPPGFQQISQALKAKTVSPATLNIPEGAPKVTIIIYPGYKHE